MRRILLIAFLCFLAVAMCGCKKAQLRRQLKELMGSTIVLPEKITCVYNGEIYPMPDSLRNKPKLIVYIDSTECTTCRISRIRMYRPLFDLASRKGDYIVFLFLSNTRFGDIPLIRYLSDLELDVPLYVDDDNVFLAINPTMDGDARLHSLLLDNKGKPLFVGDPAKSEEVQRLFYKRFNVK